MQSRRSFLKKTAAASAAAIAAPYVVPGSVLGLDGVTAPSNKINVAMVGLGRQAVAYNLPFYNDAPDAQVVALCDVDSWRLDPGNSPRMLKTCKDKDAAAKMVKSTVRSQDFREVIARKDVDAVMVSTADHSHVPISLAAVEAGKDVCCEKPLARTIADTRRLADAVKKHKRVFRTDSEFRSIPHLHRAVELVRNGAIGKIVSIESSVPGGRTTSPTGIPTTPPANLDYKRWQEFAREQPYTETRVHPQNGWGRPGWMCILDYCDGMISNWGAHINDIMQWGNNTEHTGPVEVSGEGKFIAPGGLWNTMHSFVINYRYANGVKLTYRTGGVYVHFIGTDGWIKAHWRAKTPIEVSDPAILQTRLGDDAVRFPLEHEKRNFLGAVKSRKPPMNDAETGHRTNTINLLGHIAVHVGGTLKWDPDKEQFEGNDKANSLVDKPILAQPKA